MVRHISLSSHLYAHCEFQGRQEIGREVLPSSNISILVPSLNFTNLSSAVRQNGKHMIHLSNRLAHSSDATLSAWTKLSELLWVEGCSDGKFIWPTRTSLSRRASTSACNLSTPTSKRFTTVQISHSKENSDSETGGRWEGLRPLTAALPLGRFQALSAALPPKERLIILALTDCEIMEIVYLRKMQWLELIDAFGRCKVDVTTASVKWAFRRRYIFHRKCVLLHVKCAHSDGKKYKSTDVMSSGFNRRRVTNTVRWVATVSRYNFNGRRLIKKGRGATHVSGSGIGGEGVIYVIIFLRTTACAVLLGLPARYNHEASRG